MELHQVRYFIALCKSLNFTRAAEACNITQSALTRAIQKLEDELGGPLLQRERNLTQLSELGRLMQPLLEQSLAMADAAKDHADKFRNGEKASLHLGLPSMVYAGVARDILAEVINRLPALEVALSADSQPRMIEELLQGEVDAAFLVDDGNLPERLITWILYKERFQIVIAPDHPLAKLESIPVNALAGQSIVECRECCISAKLRELCAQMGVALRSRHFVDTEDHLQHLASISLGFALLPEKISAMPPLVTRTLAGADLSQSIVLAVVSGRRFSPALNLFIRVARARNFAVEKRNRNRELHGFAFK